MSEAELDGGFFGEPGEGSEPTTVGNGGAMLDMSVLTADPGATPTPEAAPAPVAATPEPAPAPPTDDAAFGALVDGVAVPAEPVPAEAAPVHEPTRAAPEPAAVSAVPAEPQSAESHAAERQTAGTDRWSPPLEPTAGAFEPAEAAIDAPVEERWAAGDVDEPDPFAAEPTNPNPFEGATEPSPVSAAPMSDPMEQAANAPLDPNALQGEAELDRIISDRLVTMMYQPITSLLDDSVVGYEALARGPEGSPLSTPAAMFQAAEEFGRVRDLDLHCQDQAVVQARDVLLKSGHALFVNVESSVLGAAAFGRDPDAAQSFSSLLENITAACPVVLEISDLDDFSSNAELLGITRWARKKGFRVALDDIGVNARSLSILPLIEPDVIKLQRGITSASPDADLGELLSVIRSQSERTGAAVVCPGIESEEERQVALSFGATHVQGFAIGYPEELSDAPLRIRSLEPVGASWGEPCSTPFELVANSSAVRTGTEDLMLALTLDLERQAKMSDSSVILSSFERTVSAPAAVASRYEELAQECGFVVALGQDLGGMQDVFTGPVEGSDPLSGERAIVVMTPQFSAALLGRMAGGSEHDRRYAYALIYDRGQVTRAARMLTGYVNL